MASNNDNAMSRFLFAILQQKNLKDIDWNQVAHNPILTQGITNGHAARMRYSRFRQSILGHEPQRRNRNPNKSRINKSKKESKGKKDKDEQIKPDPNTTPDARQEDPKTEFQQSKNDALVKTEAEAQPHTSARLTPAELPPVSMADAHMHFQTRLLTPCSDTDMFGSAQHGFTTSPVSDLHHDQPFDYTGTAGQCAGHGSSSWHSSPSFSPYLHPYDLEGYSAPPAFCGGHQQGSHPENFGINPSAMMAPDASHVPVKHEEWDTRFHT